MPDIGESILRACGKQQVPIGFAQGGALHSALDSLWESDAPVGMTGRGGCEERGEYA